MENSAQPPQTVGLCPLVQMATDENFVVLNEL